MKKWMLTLGAWAVVSQLTMAQVIIQHANDNDPVGEGFTKSTDFNTSIGFGTNDGGTLAWSILDNDTDKLAYRYDATGAQQALLATQGWQVVAKVHMVDAADSFGDPSQRSIEVNFENNNGRRYNFRLGIGTGIHAGDASVYLSGNSAPDASLYVAGKATGFHTWELRKPRNTDVAQLWVDNSFVTNFMVGVDATDPGRFYWGAVGNASEAQANWAQVYLEVPEPSALAMLTLAGGCLLFARSRNRA